MSMKLSEASSKNVEMPQDLYGAVEKTIVLPGTIEKAFRAGKTAVVLPMWRLLESLSFRLISMVALSGLQVTGKVHCVLGRSLLLQPHCRSHADELEWYHLHRIPSKPEEALIALLARRIDNHHESNSRSTGLLDDCRRTDDVCASAEHNRRVPINQSANTELIFRRARSIASEERTPPQ